MGGRERYPGAGEDDRHDTADPAGIEFGLLRAAQEALANVARHAQASRVGLTLSYMENEVALDVRDDGVGFDPATVPDTKASA